MQIVHGVGASSGIAVAPIIVLLDDEFEVPDHADPMSALADASAAVGDQLRSLSQTAADRGRDDAAEVLNAQSLMAEDTMIADGVATHLDQGKSFDAALAATATELAEMLASLPDPYLAARAADVGEVTLRLRRHLAGVPVNETLDLTEPSILCAERITAAETANLDTDLVVGFATVEGGTTSHVAIIARAIGVPAVVGAANLIRSAQTGLMAALDGTSGELVIQPDADTVADFNERAAKESAVRQAAEAYQGASVSFDGNVVHISANVANPADVERAAAEASDGIGLMRTEFLFLDRSTPPTEDEQVEVYSTALAAFTEPVVVRTFDIGGDKPAEFLDLDPGENPFLGVRGVRLYEHTAELFHTQLRALLRSAVQGQLWVMIPMIATPAEVLTIREQVESARQELETEGVETGRFELGVMIEVPSAALTAKAMAEVADFFSIGTNDLTQYTLAADRTNGAVDHLQDPLHPSVLALCRMTAEAAQAAGKPVSVCGEAAADPLAAALFVGMGINKLSVSAPSVNLIKSTIDQLNPKQVAAAVTAASAASEAPEVRQLVAEQLDVS